MRHTAFVIRLSNSVYSADDFENFQKHFTLMSLLDDAEMRDIRQPGGRTNVVYPEFIAELNEEIKATGCLQHKMGGCEAPAIDEQPSLVQWETHIMPRMHYAVTTVFKVCVRVI